MSAPDRRLLDWAAAALGGRSVVSATGLRDGGTPWLVELADGTAAVLRVGSPGTRPAMETEVAALRVTAGGQLPTPALLAADLDGTALDGRPAVLSSRLAGSSRCTEQPPLSRFEALGAAAAAVHRVPVPSPSHALPRRTSTIPDVDFGALRRAAPRRPLLDEAEAALTATPPREEPDVFLHGDLWQGNTLWDGDVLTGVVDWDCAGTGSAGVDVGSLRCDAWVTGGPAAAEAVLSGYTRAGGSAIVDVALWDLIAGLATPPTMDWFVAANHDQGRADLDQQTMVERRDAYLRAALDRLG